MDVSEGTRRSVQQCKSTRRKVVETGFCILAFIAMGLHLEIYGPTLIDLKIKFSANYEDVISSVAARNIGLIPGSVLGGILVDKFGGFCHLMIAICLIFGGVVTVPVPLIPNVDYLWLLCFVGGSAEAMINVACQRLILKLWRDKSAGPIILLHSGFTLGALLVPLYSNPFLAIERTSDISNGTVNSTSSSTNATSSTPEGSAGYIVESRIQYIYMISGIPALLLSLAFFVLQVDEIKTMRNHKQVCEKAVDVSETFLDKQEVKFQRTFREMIDPATCAGGRRFYGIQIWILVVFHYANASGGERMLSGFVRAYSMDQLAFKISDASFINTSFWAGATVGRLSFFVLAQRICVRSLIVIESGAVLGISILMYFFAFDSQTAYWVLVMFLGFFISPMCPSVISWTDFHIELTGLGLMVLLLGTSMGGVCHLKLIGYFYEHVGARTFIYQILVFGALAFTLAVVLDLVGAQHGNRFKIAERKDLTPNRTTLTVSDDNADNTTVL